MDAQSRHPDSEREPESRLRVENADGPQHERRDGRHGSDGNGQLAPGDVTELCPVESPAALEAFAKGIGVHVRSPEDEHCHAHHHGEPPDVRLLAVSPSGHSRHHDDRSVDGSGDSAGGPEDQPLRSTVAHHLDSVLFYRRLLAERPLGRSVA